MGIDKPAEMSGKVGSSMILGLEGKKKSSLNE